MQILTILAALLLASCGINETEKPRAKPYRMKLKREKTLKDYKKYQGFNLSNKSSSKITLPRESQKIWIEIQDFSIETPIPKSYSINDSRCAGQQGQRVSHRGSRILFNKEFLREFLMQAVIISEDIALSIWDRTDIEKVRWEKNSLFIPVSLDNEKELTFEYERRDIKDYFITTWKITGNSNSCTHHPKTEKHEEDRIKGNLSILI